MIQIDGSHHRWLEDRLDQEFCLMAYVDDATGELYGRFYEYEGVFPVLDSFQGFMKRHGKPQSVYLDRHATYKTTRKTVIDEDLAGEVSQTQFQRIMKDLNIRVIFARSPQAKGRVERVFETLQDRLVKEMRLANICTIEAANAFLVAYLPHYNAKFNVAAQAACEQFEAIPDEFDFKWTFSVMTHRMIHKDYTIQFFNRIFVAQYPSLSIRQLPVTIRQALDGDLRFDTRLGPLAVTEITEKATPPKKLTQREIKDRLRRAAGDSPKSKKSWMDQVYFGKHGFSQPSAVTAR